MIPAATPTNWRAEMEHQEDWVIISAIAQYAYCPRRCGLIHVEQIYEENLFTLRGSQIHERVHAGRSGWEQGRRVERGLPVWSERLGLYGVADLVEFWEDGTIYPVEYKHGAPGARRVAEHQLCAQALCLEEMFGIPVLRGAVYAHQTHRRQEVTLDAALREATEHMVEQVRALLRSGALPPPVNDRRCPRCSLVDACAPAAVSLARRFSSRRLYVIPAEEQ